MRMRHVYMVVSRLGEESAMSVRGTEGKAHAAIPARLVN
jgi:hypothetical protein